MVQWSRNLPANAGHTDSIPVLGGSHMPWRNKPRPHSYWTCVLEPRIHNYWAHKLQLPKPSRFRAHALQQEKPLQWEAQEPQLEKAHTQQQRASTLQRRPSGAKKKNYLNQRKHLSKQEVRIIESFKWIQLYHRNLEIEQNKIRYNLNSIR